MDNTRHSTTAGPSTRSGHPDGGEFASTNQGAGTTTSGSGGFSTSTSFLMSYYKHESDASSSSDSSIYTAMTATGTSQSSAAEAGNCSGAYTVGSFSSSSSSFSTTISENTQSSTWQTGMGETMTTTTSVVTISQTTTTSSEGGSYAGDDVNGHYVSAWSSTSTTVTTTDGNSSTSGSSSSGSSGGSLNGIPGFSIGVNAQVSGFIGEPGSAIPTHFGKSGGSKKPKDHAAEMEEEARRNSPGENDIRYPAPPAAPISAEAVDENLSDPNFGPPGASGPPVGPPSTDDKLPPQPSGDYGSQAVLDPAAQAERMKQQAAAYRAHEPKHPAPGKGAPVTVEPKRSRWDVNREIELETSGARMHGQTMEVGPNDELIEAGIDGGSIPGLMAGAILGTDEQAQRAGEAAKEQLIWMGLGFALALGKAFGKLAGKTGCFVAGTPVVVQELSEGLEVTTAASEADSDLPLLGACVVIAGVSGYITMRNKRRNEDAEMAIVESEAEEEFEGNDEFLRDIVTARSRCSALTRPDSDGIVSGSGDSQLPVSIDDARSGCAVAEQCESPSRADRVEDHCAAFEQRVTSIAGRRFGGMFALTWLIACVGFGASLLLRSVPSSWPFGRSEPSADTASAETIPIEQVRLGQRLPGRNPVRDEVETDVADPDPANWREIHLRMSDGNREPLVIELLRPLEWIETHGAAHGSTVWMDLPEMGAGPADVVHIGPCPNIEPTRRVGTHPGTIGMQPNATAWIKYPADEVLPLGIREGVIVPPYWIELPADDASPDGLAIEITGGVVTGRASQEAHVTDHDILGTRYTPGDLDRTDVTGELWRSIDLILQKPDGSIANISVARPIWWMEETNAEVGQTIDLSIVEAGIEGQAEVLRIDAFNADTQEGVQNGGLVIGRIEHENCVVLDLVFDNDTTNPLGVTANHPMFSADRDGWVTAGEVNIGERLQTTKGTTTLTHRSQRPGRHKVYNLEVHRNHSYFVSQFGILAHNNGISCGFKDAWIKRELYGQLQGLAGTADKAKFVAALKKGLVGPVGQSGIKKLGTPVRGFTHELKIGGSAQRLLGRINEHGILVFEEFVRGGLH